MNNSTPAAYWLFLWVLLFLILTTIYMIMSSIGYSPSVQRAIETGLAKESNGKIVWKSGAVEYIVTGKRSTSISEMNRSVANYDKD